MTTAVFTFEEIVHSLGQHGGEESENPGMAKEEKSMNNNDGSK